MTRHAWKIALLFAELLAPYCAAAEMRAKPADESPLLTYPDDRSGTGEAYGCLTLEIVTGKAERREYFAQDNRIPAEWRPRESDYLKSGFDIGHQAAALWYKGDQQLMAATFRLTNAAPENPSFNRGLGREIEQQIVDEVTAGTKVHFAVTPLWVPAEGVVEFRVIGKHCIWVPTHKAWSILIDHRGELAMKCWIVPNAAPEASATPWEFRATVDEHEFHRKRDFFAWLDDDIEAQLEATK